MVTRRIRRIRVGPGELCPRCGLPIKSIKKRVINGRVYYYAYHKGGKECYLGPDTYVYVTRTHEDLGLILQGAVEPNRVVDYVRVILNHVDPSEVTEEQARQLARVVARWLAKWSRVKKARGTA